MAASSAASIVDPTKSLNYPVVLSDALMQGKSSGKEVFTGVRYNHKPTLSSETAPSTARLKSATNGAYELSFQDGGGRYAFVGTRSTKDNDFVLVLDSVRKVFVLHRVDSIFNMNLTRTPTNTDAASLKEQHPHLDNSIKVNMDNSSSSSSSSSSNANTNTTKNTKGRGKAPDKKPRPIIRSGGTPALKSNSDAKKKQPKEKSVQIVLPMPNSAPESGSTKPAKDDTRLMPPPPPPPASSSTSSKKAAADEYDDDDDSDDGVLVLEFPEGKAGSAARRPDVFSPAFSSAAPTASSSSASATTSSVPPVQIRRFSDFEREGDADDADADAEAEDDFDGIWEVDEGEGGSKMEGLSLPSPVNNNNNSSSGTGAAAAANNSGGNSYDDDMIDADLEAELEKELMESESEVSEED